MRRVYDNEDILLEYDSGNELRASYLHGPGVDGPLAMTRNGCALLLSSGWVKFSCNANGCIRATRPTIHL